MVGNLELPNQIIHDPEDIRTQLWSYQQVVFGLCHDSMYNICEITFAFNSTLKEPSDPPHLNERAQWEESDSVRVMSQLFRGSQPLYHITNSCLVFVSSWLEKPKQNKQIQHQSSEALNCDLFCQSCESKWCIKCPTTTTGRSDSIA